jgi:hypothetical protein
MVLTKGKLWLTTVSFRLAGRMQLSVLALGTRDMPIWGFLYAARSILTPL